ncbi:MAG: helix-turn-helix domain-containing protein [Bacteroidaceae bacterium]
MKQETYVKVVNEVVQRIAQHTDVVMNVEQVAKYLGLSVGAVRKRCQRATLPFHRNSRHLYFSKIEVDAAILNRSAIDSCL